MDNPVWQPQHPEQSRMAEFLHFAEQSCDQKFADYEELYQWSINQPEQFWLSLSRFFKVIFTTPPRQILNKHTHLLDARWFEGAEFNFAAQLLQRQDNHPALISINETGDRKVVTYQQLRRDVAACAASLQHAGVGVGDRVAAVMPNVAYTIIAMLAASSLGAIWSSCSPDFGADAAVDRLGQIDPKVVFLCDGHQYMGKTHDAGEKNQAIIQALPDLKTLVICSIINSPTSQTLLPDAIDWDSFVQKEAESCFTALPFNHPLYILFSSGTTGKPKCIVHGAGGTLLQHLKELGLHSNMSDRDNLCFYTTCGWMMWNWMVSGLALGATLTLYEGAPNYPDAYRMFQLIEEEQISIFGTSPRFLSAVEKAGVNPGSRYTFPHLRSILSTGSPLLPENYDFVYQQIKKDVQLSSISGGTDIVSCFALGNPMLPVYRGELQCRGLGMAVRILNNRGEEVTLQRGELVCTQAFPSMPVAFWSDPTGENYRHAYFDRFDNVWAHGDFAELTEHQGVIIHGRSDAVLNPGGVRIGTAEIYRQVEKSSEVLESVVIGQEWQGDVRIVLFVKLREGLLLDDELQSKIRRIIRSNASPRHVPAKILQVAEIPRTVSGKIVEIAVRDTVNGKEVSNLGSLANPEALHYYRDRPELRF